MPTGGSVTVVSNGETGTVTIGGVVYQWTAPGSISSCAANTNCVLMSNSGAAQGHDNSAEALYRAINNTGASSCSNTGATNPCYKLATSPAQGANAEATATYVANTAVVHIGTWNCAGPHTNFTITDTAGDTLAQPTGGSNGTTTGSNFAIPNPASNAILSANINSAIGTSGAAGFAKSYTSPTITLTASTAGSTGIADSLVGSPTGITVGVTTPGSNGVTSGTSTPPTFAYWSGSTYVTQSALASTIASVLSGAGSNTTTDAVLTATSNANTTNNLTITALATGAESGTGGNSIAVTPSNFAAFTGPTNLSGGTTGTVQPNMWPAKFSFSTTTASCSDFVVYPTGVAGATGAANIVAYSNLYTGGCTAPVPSVLWAYNTGGTVTTSPIISVDGTQVAFIQSNGTTAYLVLLKWAAGTGTISAPATPTLASSASVYRNSCPAPCYYTVSLGADDTYSAPFYDYIAASDAIYVGDDVGRLHKITGVFYGSTIAEPTNWPVTLNSASGHKTASPVFDNTSGYVFVGNSNFTTAADLYAVGTGWAGTTSGSTHGTSGSLGDAIVDGTLVDPSAEEVYAFVTTDAAGDNAVYQFPAAFTSGVGSVEKVGYGGTGYYLYSGDFDNVYYSSTNGTAGDLWVVGNTGGSSGGGGGSVTLYRIPIGALSAMSTPVAAITGLTAAHQVTAVASSSINVTTGSTTGSISLDLSTLTSSANNRLLVGISIVGLTDTTPTVSSVTWHGTALTLVPACSVQESASTSNWVSMAIYELQNPSTSNSTVAITLTGSTAFQAGAVAFTNVASLGTCQTQATNGAEGVNSTSVTVTAPGTGGAVFDTLAVKSIVPSSSFSMTPTASQTSLWNLVDSSAPGSNCQSGGCTDGGAGSYAGNVTTMSYSFPGPSLSNTAYGAVPLIAAEAGINYGWPSPITEFCNGACTVSGGVTTTGTDYLFFSVDGLETAIGSCTAGSGNGCVLGYNVSIPTGPTNVGGQPVTTVGTPGCWSTSGIEIDNSATSTGASNIYVLALNGNVAGGPTLGTNTSSTCGTGDSATPFAYQFSQSAP